jgi:tetratricopeptide (TPR) repeat protein
MKDIFIFKSLIFIIIARGLIVVLHELGHAIPAIILSRKKVSIYIGSYGDSKESFNFKIGLLDVWLNYKMMSWKNGLCVPSAKSISINRQIVYVLLGPLTSMILSSIFLYFTLSMDLSDSYLHFAVIFFFMSIFDLFRNLIPNKNPIQLSNGEITYNDGYSLVKLFKYRSFKNEFEEAIDLYNKKEYQKSILLLDFLIKSNLKDDNIYRLAVSANLQNKTFERAKILFDESVKEFKLTLTSDDYLNGGLAYNRLHLNEKSLELYDESLELNPDNVYSLNNKGFALIALNRYFEAIPYFDKVLEINDSSAYSYNNRGLCKIKTGNPTEGLIDIEKSLKLDENNSYAYRNLGIYHFDKNEINKARELFLKSKELDCDTYMIDELILSTDDVNF